MTILKSLTCVLALMAALLSTNRAAAEEAVFDNCKVVKVEDRRLTLQGPGGQEHSAEVASDAAVTVDGKATPLGDLKSGLRIKVTVRKGEGTPVILKVEGRTNSLKQ